MVDTVQIGRKLIHKRKERQLISRAVQQFSTANTQQSVSPKAELSLDTRNAPGVDVDRTAYLSPPPVAKPNQGDLLALIQRWKDEAARMTPEEIAAEDAAYATPGITRQAPAPGYAATVALFRQWEEEAARMTPEEIADDDEVSDGLLENVEKYPLSLRIPDLSDHD